MHSIIEKARTVSELSLKQSLPKVHNPVDAELEALLAQQKAKIKVVGCGGAGNNTINRMYEVGIKGCETIAVNTDAQDLLYTNADVKIRSCASVLTAMV